MSDRPCTTEGTIDRLVERALADAVVGDRRGFLKLVGASTASAALASVFPVAAAKALARKKKDLKVGFIPITCATSIVMAEPMGFYKKYGLNVAVVKASGWAMIRDLSINKETDATHMLSPMPLAISMGVGSQAVPSVMQGHAGDEGRARHHHDRRQVPAILMGRGPNEHQVGDG